MFYLILIEKNNILDFKMLDLTKTFKYKINSNGFNSDIRYIKCIFFDISRYGKHNYIIKCRSPKTEIEAIKEVEKFLSEPITKSYFDNLEDDLFGDLNFENLEENGITCKGDLLVDCIFLESIKSLKNNHSSVIFNCGS